MHHLFRLALECGYELVDTAQARDWYDESAVGQALQNYEKENRNNKEKKTPVFVTSKLDPRLIGYESALKGKLFSSLVGHAR